MFKQWHACCGFGGGGKQTFNPKVLNHWMILEWMKRVAVVSVCGSCKWGPRFEGEWMKSRGKQMFFLCCCCGCLTRLRGVTLRKQKQLKNRDDEEERMAYWWCVLVVLWRRRISLKARTKKSRKQQRSPFVCVLCGVLQQKNKSKKLVRNVK